MKAEVEAPESPEKSTSNIMLFRSRSSVSVLVPIPKEEFGISSFEPDRLASKVCVWACARQVVTRSAARIRKVLILVWI